MLNRESEIKTKQLPHKLVRATVACISWKIITKLTTAFFLVHDSYPTVYEVHHLTLQPVRLSQVLRSRSVLFSIFSGHASVCRFKKNEKSPKSYLYTELQKKRIQFQYRN